jgi:hypothetical protein
MSRRFKVTGALAFIIGLLGILHLAWSPNPDIIQGAPWAFTRPTQFAGGIRVLDGGHFDTMTVESCPNFAATETGAANAPAGCIPGLTLKTGTPVCWQQAHALRATTASNANTFSWCLQADGGPPSNIFQIRSHFNTANGQATGYSTGTIFRGIDDGTYLEDDSE